MTLPEFIGGAGATLGAAIVAYRQLIQKIDNTVGKKEGDSSLRDIVMKIDGKLDAQADANREQFHGLSRRLEHVESMGAKADERLETIEARVFTPPQRAAFRVAAGGKGD